MNNCEKDFLRDDFNTRVYIADTGVLSNAELYNNYYKELSDYRKEKVDRSRNIEDKIRSLAAGILLDKAYNDSCSYVNDKYGIQLWHNKTPLIVKGNNGKPYFDNSPVYFNLSHSGKRVMCAISFSEVGCDVEHKQDKRGNIARRFFTQSECDYINSKSIDNSKNTSAFTKIWSMKESVLKASSFGVSYPLNSFSVADNEKKLVDQIDFGPDKTRYYFKRYNLGDEYEYVCCCLSSHFEESLIQVKL